MKIQASEILPYGAYEPCRAALRARALEEKRPRRVHLGPLTFLFENATTLRYQVHSDLAALTDEVALTPEQRAALAADLRASLA